MREFDPCTVKRALDGAWGWSSGSKRIVHCQKCRYPDCKQCLEEGVDKRTLEEKMYPTTAAHYHNGTDFYCRAHRYPPCPGCGAPRPRRKGGEFHSDHSVFNQPVWLCDGCKTADAQYPPCLGCGKPRPKTKAGAHRPDYAEALKPKWKCAECSKTFKCTVCAFAKSREAFDSTHLSNHLKYGRDLRCESCRANPTSKTYTCGECGKPKPPEAYDSTHLSNHLKYDGRALRCEDCKSKRDKQTYKCHRCDGRYFPPEHFDKRDLNKLQQGRKAKETLMCRK